MVETLVRGTLRYAISLGFAGGTIFFFSSAVVSLDFFFLFAASRMGPLPWLRPDVRAGFSSGYYPIVLQFGQGGKQFRWVIFSVVCVCGPREVSDA